jgi:hypothetical protein
MATRGDWLYKNEAAFTLLCEVWKSILVVEANQTAYGWIKERCLAVISKIDAYLASLSMYRDAPTNANHHRKEDDKEAAETAIRSFARAYVRYNPAVPHEVLVQLNMVAPDEYKQAPTQIPEFGPSSTVIATDRAPGYMRVRYEGAKPHGAIGCEIMWQVSVDVPADVESFTNSQSEVFTRNPWKKVFKSVKPGEKLHYVLRWVFTGERYSPWSKIESATIT